MPEPLKCPRCGSETLYFHLRGTGLRNEGVDPGLNRDGGYPTLVSIDYIESVGCGNRNCEFFIYHGMAEEKWKKVPALAPGSRTRVERTEEFNDIMNLLKSNPELEKKLKTLV